MRFGIKMEITQEMEEDVERLRKQIAPDDTYLYIAFLIQNMSQVIHAVYDMNPELYTAMCLEEPQALAFLNVLAQYENLLHAPQRPESD